MTILLLCLTFSAIVSCAMENTQPNPALPEYVTVKEEVVPAVLRSVAQPLQLPLSQKDIDDIEMLSKKFDNEKEAAGLAAPQIEISKQIIVFAFEQSKEDLKNFNLPKDSKMMPKTIWINPKYNGVGDKKESGVEACYSVPGMCAIVDRYKKITYSAYDYKTHKMVEGEAEGYLARIIQHEIDHLKGVLYTDIAKPHTIKTQEQYKKEKEANKKQ